MSYKLSLDRKQIEDMLLLGLRVSGFHLESDKVIWDRKKGATFTATVQVSADQGPIHKKSIGGQRAPGPVPMLGQEATPEESTKLADPGVTIPDQEGTMPAEEVESFLRNVGAFNVGERK